MATATDFYTLVARMDDKMSRKVLLLDRLVGRFGGTFMNVYRRIAVAGAGIGAAIGAIYTKMVDLAMRAEETENLMELAFRNSKADAKEWASEVSDALGMNEFQAREYRTQLKLLANEMAISQEQGDAFSSMFVKLAGDIRSAFNVPGGLENVMVKLRAGLTGEYEPLRRVNVYLSEVAVNAKAAEMGFEKMNGQYSQTAKFLSRVNLIMEGTKQVHGDLSATLGSATNQWEIIKNKISETATEIGLNLLPFVNQLFTQLNTWIGNNKQFVIDVAVEGAETFINTMLKLKDVTFLVIDTIIEKWDTFYSMMDNLPGTDPSESILDNQFGQGAWGGQGREVRTFDVWEGGEKVGQVYEIIEEKTEAVVDNIEEAVELEDSFLDRINEIINRQGIQLGIARDLNVNEEKRVEAAEDLAAELEALNKMDIHVMKPTMITMEETNKELKKIMEHFDKVNSAASPTWETLQDINEELVLINQATVPVDQSVFDQIVTDLIEIDRGLDAINIPERLRKPLEETYGAMIQNQIATDDFNGLLKEAGDDMDTLTEKTYDWAGAFQRAFEGGGNLLGGFKSILTDLFDEKINIKLGGGTGFLGGLGNALSGMLSGGLSSLIGAGLGKLGGWIGGMFKSEEEKRAERRAEREEESSERWDTFTRERGHRELVESAGLGLDHANILNQLFESGDMFSYNMEIERLEELTEAREAERLEMERQAEALEKAKEASIDFTTNLLTSLTGIETGHALDPLKEHLETALGDAFTSFMPTGTEGMWAFDAFERIKQLYDEAVIDLEGTEKAADKWLGVEDGDYSMLGDAYQAADISKQLLDAGKEFDLLMKSGLSEWQTVELLGDEEIDKINDMVARAATLGVTIPESMRPILAAMADAGDLAVDFDSIEFGSGLTEPMDALVIALSSLIDELGGELPEALRTYIDSFTQNAGEAIQEDIIDPLSKKDLPPPAIPLEPVIEPDAMDAVVDDIAIMTGPSEGMEEVWRANTDMITGTSLEQWDMFFTDRVSRDMDALAAENNNFAVSAEARSGMFEAELLTQENAMSDWVDRINALLDNIQDRTVNVNVNYNDPGNPNTGGNQGQNNFSGETNDLLSDIRSSLLRQERT